MNMKQLIDKEKAGTLTIEETNMLSLIREQRTIRLNPVFLGVDQRKSIDITNMPQ